MLQLRLGKSSMLIASRGNNLLSITSIDIVCMGGRAVLANSVQIPSAQRQLLLTRQAHSRAKEALCKI
jgi:hypothetical protein